jgi:Tfp pilus assembly protein PilF
MKTCHYRLSVLSLCLISILFSAFKPVAAELDRIAVLEGLAMRYEAMLGEGSLKDPDVNLKLARVYLDLKKYDKSKRQIELAQKKNSNTKDITFAWAEYYYAIKNRDLAKKYFQDIVHQDSTHETALYNLGAILTEEKQWSQARDNFQKLISLNSKHYAAFIAKGECESKLGNHKQATVDFLNAVKIEPSIGIAYLKAAESKEKSGDKVGAQKIYNTLLKAPSTARLTIDQKETVVKNLIHLGVRQ